jgi:hypothetical protein
MPLHRRHEADGAVLMRVVVPRHKGCHPPRGAGEIRKGVAREIRVVPYRSDQPIWPRAMICCCVAHGGERPRGGRPAGYASARQLWWPDFMTPLVAGLGCPPRPNHIRTEQLLRQSDQSNVVGF